MAAEVGIRDLRSQLAARVHQGDDQLLRRVPVDRALHDAAQQRRLAAAAVTEHQQVRVARDEVERDRLHRVLAEAQGHGIRFVDRVGQLGRRQHLGQQPDGRRALTAPPGRALAGELFERLAGVAVVDLFEQRQCDLREQLLVGEHAPRLVGAERLRELARDLRVGGVVELQLEARADEALQVHAQLVPARQGDDDMDAEAATAFEQLRERGLEVFEVLPQRPESVDEQHDVGAGEIGQASVGVLTPHVGERVEVLVAEHALAHREHARELFEQTREPLAAAAGRDTTDVGERLDAREAPAGEVHAVDAHLARRVRERQRRGERPQEHRAPRLRCAGDRDVSARACEIEHPRRLGLLRRVVDEAHRGPERPGAVGLRQHAAEGQHGRERRQPHWARAGNPACEA